MIETFNIKLSLPHSLRTMTCTRISTSSLCATFAQTHWQCGSSTSPRPQWHHQERGGRARPCEKIVKHSKTYVPRTMLYRHINITIYNHNNVPSSLSSSSSSSPSQKQIRQPCNPSNTKTTTSANSTKASAKTEQKSYNITDPCLKGS